MNYFIIILVFTTVTEWSVLSVDHESNFERHIAFIRECVASLEVFVSLVVMLSDGLLRHLVVSQH